MGNYYYYEDARWPWRPDAILQRWLPKQEKEVEGRGTPQRRGSQRDRKQRKEEPRALDLGMGYGRNALWLAEQGYQVEGWEIDAPYLREARRAARRRGVRLRCRRFDFARKALDGPYDAIVISQTLNQVPHSAALRVLRAARGALAAGGRLFLLVKLTRDRYFQRWKRSPEWGKVPGEKNTLRRLQPAQALSGKPRRIERVRQRGLWVQSTLTPAEVKRALRGLRLLHFREVVLRSEWETEEPVTHTVAEVVAEKPRPGKRSPMKRRGPRGREKP